MASGFVATLINDGNPDLKALSIAGTKSEQSVTNYTRRHHRGIRWLIGLEYKTTIEQLRNIRNSINELINRYKSVPPI